ncbi:MAG TPA: type II secretion system protein GspG [bacterium]|nr:type II secretion system protein GspG [bacterium]HPN29644.1 type II secretion system protein GspG [bacterium]
MNKKKRIKGFTLLELLIVVAIIGILAVAAIPKYFSSIEKAKIAVAVTNIASLNKSILLFRMDNNRIPDESLEELVPLYMPKIPLDPWNNPYKYYNHSTNKGSGKKRMDGPIVPINKEFDLYSEGANMKSTPTVRSEPGKDDIILANDGQFIGIAENY